MLSILDFFNKYSSKIDYFDLELLISRVLKKPREFVLANPSFKISKTRGLKLETLIRRRIKHEPLAYILGRKEFYNLTFKVDKNVLIPRPETELLVDLALKEISNSKFQVSSFMIIDIGTGSGCIIISLLKQLQVSPQSNKFGAGQANFKFYGIDISAKAIKIAKQNAKTHQVGKKIKFFKGNLLNPLKRRALQAARDTQFIIVANLPYLSKSIYRSASPDVKKFEPEIALLSPDEGLDHYAKLFRQIQKSRISSRKLRIFLEISPEQKNKISKLIKSLFSRPKIKFEKDLAGKWRVCKMKIN